MGDRFSEDPFVLFQLRGRSRAQLLKDLAERRRQQNQSGSATQSIGAAPPDPAAWWSYSAALDPNLVVITPAMEGSTGLDEAGDLPLAAEPRFPEANQLFLERLRQHGTQMGQMAMVQAMAAGSDP